MYLFIVTLLIFFPSLGHTAGSVDELSLPTAPALLSDLGQELRRGVDARVRLEPLPLLDSSEPLDVDLHHYRISIVFSEEKSGRELLEGQVAARTFAADRRVAETVRLELQQRQWAGVLVLPSTNETMIKVGTKLEDGKKRIYRFFYNPQSGQKLQADLAPSE